MIQTKLLAVAAAVAFLSGCAISPEPFDDATIAADATADSRLIYDSQQPLEGPLSLGEAMARAVKYNLENRVQLMEHALATSSFELVKMDMLPVLAASAGYTDRNNVHASRSYNIITRQDNYSYSTSQDEARRHADVRFAWNVLDFGVSYLQAKQESDRTLVSELGRRKVMLKLLEQVRGSYWRAAAMQRVAGDLDALLERSRNALVQLRRVREEQLRPPLATLQELRTLVEVVQQLEQMQQTVNMARVELASLINQPPGSKVELALSPELPTLPAAESDISELEVAALIRSSDYVGELYNARIDQLESRKALLRLLPGLEFSYSANYDSNSYLYNEAWGEAGLRVTWNLFRLFASGDIEEHNEARERLAMGRRLAMNMAVVTKLHLSWQEYRNTYKRLGRAEELDRVDQDISKLTRHARSSDAASGVEQLQSEARALRSTMGRLLAYAEAQGAYGSLLFSLGADPVPAGYQQLPVAELARVLSEAVGRWEAEGALPGRAESAPSAPAGLES